MNANTIARFEGEGQFAKCGYCFGSGVLSIPNGADDFDQDFCNCPAGEELFERGFMQETKPDREERKSIQFDVSRISIYPWHKIDRLDI